MIECEWEYLGVDWGWGVLRFDIVPVLCDLVLPCANIGPSLHIIGPPS